MSHCGYFQIKKGRAVCTHPTNGEQYTAWYGPRLRCNTCRRECGGIYPSQLPYADQTGWIYDIITTTNNGLRRTIKVEKTWVHGEAR